MDVVAFILKYLKDQLYEVLGKSDLDMSRVQFDWVVTVPAIWDIRGKQMMREAAYKVPQYFLCQWQCYSISGSETKRNY